MAEADGHQQTVTHRTCEQNLHEDEWHQYPRPSSTEMSVSFELEVSAV